VQRSSKYKNEPRILWKTVIVFLIALPIFCVCCASYYIIYVKYRSKALKMVTVLNEIIKSEGPLYIALNAFR